MFGVDSAELFIIILVAVVVIGPKDLPRVLRTIGEWVGRARGMANQFRSGLDEMVRDTEIADLEEKWQRQNDAVMRAHPNPKPSTHEPDWGVERPAPTPPFEGQPVALGKAARLAPAPPPEASPPPVGDTAPPLERWPPRPQAQPSVLPDDAPPANGNAGVPLDKRPVEAVARPRRAPRAQPVVDAP